MKRNFVYPLFIIIAIGLISCEKEINVNGNFVTQMREIQPVTAIHSTGNFDIVLHKDTTSLLRIFAEEDMLSNIITECNTDGQLNLKYRDYNVKYKHKKIEIYVPVGQLKKVDVQSGGSVTGKNVSTNEVVNLNLGGNAILDFVLQTNKLLTNISGSGKIILNGKVNNTEHTISGSGELKSFGLQSQNATATLSSSGSIEVNATEYLKVNISGSGNVLYKGSPQLESHISGNGKLIKVN